MAEPLVEPARAEPESRGVLKPMILGGVVSAAIGFAAAHYLMPGGMFYPGENQELVKVQSQLAEFEENSANDIAALQTKDAALQSGFETAADEQTKLVEALTQSNTDLTARIIAIENRPIADASAEVQVALKSYVDELARVNDVLANQGNEIAAYQTRIATLEAQLADKLAAVSAQKGEAEAAAQLARLRHLFNELKGELDTGRAFGDTLEAIADASGNAAPAALVENSAGIISLSSLQSDFPDAARATLAVAIAETADPSAMGRFTAFLKSQTGARSLAAKEGDDPDAVLSRAEAALQNGDVQAAIGELTALPEGGAEEMAPWVGMAQAYADAQAGFASYSTMTLAN